MELEGDEVEANLLALQTPIGVFQEINKSFPGESSENYYVIIEFDQDVSDDYISSHTQTYCYFWKG